LYIALSCNPIPECHSIYDLQRAIINITASLSITKLALILINADQVLTSSEFIKFCEILSQNCAIIFLTNTPLNSPLQGFPPEQENLLNIIQTWLEEN
jgi:hypothetical protein